eukprot:3232992-Amphidinium_carterae.1
MLNFKGLQKAALRTTSETMTNKLTANHNNEKQLIETLKGFEYLKTLCKPQKQRATNRRDITRLDPNCNSNMI